MFVSFYFRAFWMDLLVFRWVGRCRDEGVLMCGDMDSLVCSMCVCGWVIGSVVGWCVVVLRLFDGLLCQ